jgi:2-polyprenyl-6-methoxyphenol hydroxylase-like FAD-dependent oxidoreductase
MRVIIAGAGVGGLALANGLVADGHAVRVLERARAPRADGAAVTIFSNGAAAAAGLGVPLDGLGGPIEALEFHEPDGTPFGRTDLRVMRRRTGFGVATIPRSAILDRFAGKLPADTVTYGCEVADVKVGPGGVVVAGHSADALVGADGPVAELLAVLTEDDIQEFPHVLHRVPSVWGTGPSTLLGDAAHAFPPSQAQGANQALEDAWLLRRALSSGHEPSTALRRYERVRSRRVRRISRLAASEVTNKPQASITRLVGRHAPATLSGRLQLAVIRSCSSVLNDDRV